MQVQVVLVGGPRSARPPGLQAAFQLREEARPRSQVEVAVQQDALQVIALRILRLAAEARVLEALVAQPRFRAKAEIVALARSERQALQVVPRASPVRRIA